MVDLSQQLLFACIKIRYCMACGLDEYFQILNLYKWKNTACISFPEYKEQKLFVVCNIIHVLSDAEPGFLRISLGITISLLKERKVTESSWIYILNDLFGLI